MRRPRSSAPRRPCVRACFFGTMIIHEKELREYLMQQLPQICDAEPGALSNYILTLLKRDESAAELKVSCAEKLDEFLFDATKSFVDKLIAFCTALDARKQEQQQAGGGGVVNGGDATGGGDGSGAGGGADGMSMPMPMSMGAQAGQAGIGGGGGGAGAGAGGMAPMPVSSVQQQLQMQQMQHMQQRQRRRRRHYYSWRSCCW